MTAKKKSTTFWSCSPPRGKQSLRTRGDQRRSVLVDCGPIGVRYAQERTRAIKEDAIERLPELLESVIEVIEARGGTVYVADDEKDGNRYIRTVVEEADADSVVKPTSMTSEELEVNESLEKEDVDVWETNLGEFVLQVADEAPGHLVAPAIHKSSEDIAHLFTEYFELSESLESPEELTDGLSRVGRRASSNWTHCSNDQLRIRWRSWRNTSRTINRH